MLTSERAELGFINFSNMINWAILSQRKQSNKKGLRNWEWLFYPGLACLELYVTNLGIITWAA